MKFLILYNFDAIFRPVRKLTAEAKISEMEKRRTDHLKRCRQIAETHVNDGYFIQFDNLLRDQVNHVIDYV